MRKAGYAIITASALLVIACIIGLTLGASPVICSLAALTGILTIINISIQLRDFR